MRSAGGLGYVRHRGYVVLRSADGHADEAVRHEIAENLAGAASRRCSTLKIRAKTDSQRGKKHGFHSQNDRSAAR